MKSTYRPLLNKFNQLGITKTGVQDVDEFQNLDELSYSSTAYGIRIFYDENFQTSENTLRWAESTVQIKKKKARRI